MACTIIVDHNATTGYTYAGALKEIYVKGTAIGCEKVKITIECEGIPISPETVDVKPATQTWEYLFDQLPLPCACNSEFSISVECADGKEKCINKDHKEVYDLQCKPKPGAISICPQINWNIGPYSDCQNGLRSVKFSVTIQGVPGTYSAELQDISGNIVDSQTGPSPLTLNHSGSFPGGKPQTFNLVLLQPSGCPGSTQILNIPSCEPTKTEPPAPEGKGDWGMVPPKVEKPKPSPGSIVEKPKVTGPITKKSNACGTMLWAVGAAMCLAAAAVAITLAVNLCVPGVAAISWWWAIGPSILAGALIALWYVLCTFVPDCECPTECDWAQIATMTAFASAAVVGWLAGCCPLLTWISAGFLAAFGAALGAWVKACEPGTCKVLKASLVALVSGAIPSITYIALVPTLAACGSTIVAAAAATVAGVLGVAAASKCTG